MLTKLGIAGSGASTVGAPVIWEAEFLLEAMGDRKVPGVKASAGQLSFLLNANAGEVLRIRKWRSMGVTNQLKMRTSIH